jgi:hypothetical protein
MNRRTERSDLGGGDQRTPPPTRGFSAQLRGASLWDLVQIECLSRSRRTIQVVGEGGVGYLYFDRGRVVHATTAQGAGEPAALEILAWTNGSFQPCDRPWPEPPGIQTPLEGLLLRAAQLRDEKGASNLVAFPARGAAPSAEEPYEELEIRESDEREEGESEMRSHNMDDLLPAAKGEPRAVRGESAGDFSIVMRLGPTGAVVSSRGGSEELAETVSYVQRLLQLTGEMLGLGEFSAIECTFTHQGRCMIFADSNGETVTLRPRADANLQPLRERLGL